MKIGEFGEMYKPGLIVSVTFYYSLHRQNRSGMNAPMAINTGNIAEVSVTSSYGSAALGPLGRRFLAALTSSGSVTISSSSSSLYGTGGSCGISASKTQNKMFALHTSIQRNYFESYHR